MRGSFLVAGCALLLALAACARPLPPDRQAYAGEWQSQTMALLITPAGRVVYKRAEGGMTTSVEGPLQRFDGDNFVVGVGPLNTTFVVSAPPHRDAQAWKMTVDGVELTRR
jgi:hypothetical protein